MTFQKLQSVLAAYGFPKFDRIHVTYGPVYDDDHYNNQITCVFASLGGTPVTPEWVLAYAWMFINRSGVDAGGYEITAAATRNDPAATYKQYHEMLRKVMTCIPGLSKNSCVWYDKDGNSGEISNPSLHTTRLPSGVTHELTSGSVKYSGNAQALTKKLTGHKNPLIRHYRAAIALHIPAEQALAEREEQLHAIRVQYRSGLIRKHEERTLLLSTDRQGLQVRVTDLATLENHWYTFMGYGDRRVMQLSTPGDTTFPQTLNYTPEEHQEIIQLSTLGDMLHGTQQRERPLPVTGKGGVQFLSSMRLMSFRTFHPVVLARTTDQELFCLQYNETGKVNRVIRVTGGVTEHAEFTQVRQKLLITHIAGQHSLELPGDLSAIQGKGGLNLPLERHWGLTPQTHNIQRPPYFWFSANSTGISVSGRYNQPSTGQNHTASADPEALRLAVETNTELELTDQWGTPLILPVFLAGTVLRSLPA